MRSHRYWLRAFGPPSGASWNPGRQALLGSKFVKLRPGPLSKVCRVRSGSPLSPEVIAQSAGRGGRGQLCLLLVGKQTQAQNTYLLRTRACMCSLGRSEPRPPRVGSRLHSLQVWPFCTLQPCRPPALGGSQGWPASDRQLRGMGWAIEPDDRAGRGRLLLLCRLMDTRGRMYLAVDNFRI